MQVTTISLGDVDYPFRLGTDCMDRIIEHIAALLPSRVLLMADTTVTELYGHDLAARLDRAAAPTHLLTHPCGEAGKNLTTLTALAEQALRYGLDRRSVVVALGGGVTGNMAGLLAALMFRGLRLVQVPTTVVAMLDSVLSLKQTVNAGVGKNLIGTFYAPVEVLADTALLRTLPAREVRSGAAEVVKNALAIRPAMIDYLADNLRPDGRYPDEVMAWLIGESIAAKAQVTVADKFERGTGLVLEYGHTIGHAIEHAAAGTVAHGAGVALGMLAAAGISRDLGGAGDDLVDLHHDLIGRIGVPTTITSDVDIANVKRWLRFDNKRGYLSLAADTCAMVLLSAPGKPLWTEGHPLTEVPVGLADAAVDGIASRTATPASAAGV
ncbi:2-deoxy-scyllo-inosose synthase [Saccharopolyspora phatthalungensis]|uniref:3-dehydroquinate synthase/2-deoxy-scyllo-inosose synthase n=1 Tax=Saccharopolyspora phatthalungensis TaxID=664693 RepID=A0A840QFG0_9PSEU|nr:2-deoxy-scyllo-inosose synthase [Saccharopolyspora phatthalungensis]MBB5158807.1 3-dehydroquinate synthase/2-deoxy-scyllo-inosose synthase [Saccharopolyspora phatthalungensis]